MKQLKPPSNKRVSVGVAQTRTPWKTVEPFDRGYGGTDLSFRVNVDCVTIA